MGLVRPALGGEPVGGFHPVTGVTSAAAYVKGGANDALPNETNGFFTVPDMSIPGGLG